MSAKVHSHQSNRAKSKHALERKPVFKSTLDNPLQIKWPSVPLNLQNAALSRLVLSLEGLSTYHACRDTANRKRKRKTRAQTGTGKRMKIYADDMSVVVDSPQSAEPIHSEIVTDAILTPPPVLPHITFGINQVTKRLELQARSYRETKVAENGTHSSPGPLPITIVFVCRADVDPPLLIAHLPTLIASCNSSPRALVNPTSYPSIKLVSLPLGAEMTLAEATGLRRVSIIALDANTPDLGSFDSLLDIVPILRASWLTTSNTLGPVNPIPLMPTHIKQLRTTAPKDMKVAKEQRAKGRADATARAAQSRIKTGAKKD